MTTDFTNAFESADREVRLTGRIDRSRIKLLAAPRVPIQILDELRALGDLSAAVSDALDDLGLPGAVPASQVHSSDRQGRLVGLAITLRNVPRVESVAAAADSKVNRMAELECHNLARPGDVLVIQGVADASNLGGISSRIGKRQGEVGAIIDGGVRDVSDFRANDYPVWARHITPKTGKWRLAAAEINGPVSVFGVTVHPGDLIVADSTGICFVPRENVLAVLELVRKKVKAEQRSLEAIDAGLKVWQLAGPLSPPTATTAVEAGPSAPDRLPPIPEAEWTNRQREHAQEIVNGPRGKLLAPFVPLLRSPELMSHAQRLGEYLRYRSSLGPRLFELAVLVVARHWSQDVEWAIHAPIALQEGIPENVVQAIARGERSRGLSTQELAVYDFCVELQNTKRVDEATWVACIASLGEQGTVDLMGVCGYYGFLGMVMNAARTAVPAGSSMRLPEIGRA